MGVQERYSRGRELVADWSAADALGAAAVGLLVVDLFRRLAVGDLAVSQLATYVWDGLVVGAIIGLAGVGLSMTYSILGFANFAHGDYLTTGAFAGWSTAFLVAGLGRFGAVELLLLEGIPAGELGISVTGAPVAVLAGVVVAALAGAAVSLAIDRIAYRPMRDQEGIALLIASIGVALALRYLIVFVYGQDSRGLTATAGLPSVEVPAVDGAVELNIHEVTLLVVSAGLMVGVHALLQYTKLGTAMRAMADNEDLARITGIPTERVVRWTWTIGGGLVGVAGFLITLESGTLGFNVGWLLLLLIFAAVILGGIGSIYGAIVGGLVVGLTDKLALVWLPSSLTKVAAFGILIVVLLYRPAGLFGGTTTA